MIFKKDGVLKLKENKRNNRSVKEDGDVCNDSIEQRSFIKSLSNSRTFEKILMKIISCYVLMLFIIQFWY